MISLRLVRLSRIFDFCLLVMHAKCLVSRLRDVISLSKQRFEVGEKLVVKNYSAIIQLLGVSVRSKTDASEEIVFVIRKHKGCDIRIVCHILCVFV